MRKSTALLGTLSVTCAVIAGWSWWQLRVEREHVATLEMRLEAQARTIASPTSPVAVAPVSQAPSSPSSEPAVTTADPEAARQEEIRKQILAAREHEREMMKDPAYRKSRIDDFRRRSFQTRADYIRVVGMTPEQADRVIELSVERNFRVMDLVGYAGESPTPEAQLEMERIDHDQREEVRRLLGEAKYDKYKWYQTSGQERYDANLLRAQLSTTAEPLREQQVDTLVDALYSAREQRSREYEDYVKAAGITDRNAVSPADRQRWLDLEKEANRRIHDAMSGTLSRSQLESLDEMLAQNLAPVEAVLRLQEQNAGR
jgi:hypothetical protein